MAFFQNSVINKYIQTLDKQTLQNAYAKFRAHFHNATIQENIRGSKEEQYQGEFLIDLFVNVLGYTKNPTPNFNLTTEYKNVKDSKKADGAIIINEIVKAVIELKGTNTTDLNKIEVQAFGYKNNQPECEYVITSNFEKIRFYIDNAIEYTEFNLFTLTEKEFELLYICLSYDSIAKGLPKQIKDESVSQESLITKKLYNDYSQFKNELYHSLVKLNPQYEPLELFKKSQKLLDRFLFIFFAEDRQLLPTNLIFRINKEWQQLRNMRIVVSLYDRYKIYFNDLDCGAKVSLPAFSQTASKQVEEFQIYAYNGGLFKTDDLLNDIKIEDELLFAHTEKLSNYDFASEVDVNVLGHIFENSLNDLDEIKAQLEGQEVDKTKTKRKKDGVFYTPKYITKYIVDNTVGKLCLEKKEALQLVESDYTIDKKRQKKTTQDLTDKLNEYRNWLLQLTICDPACGSGAFLNQALDFLITEHRYIDELQGKLFGDALVLSDVEGSILENNLFGVDINEESVEIAKLSLWLRTAQPNRKLNDLNRNIKCGNSLIDDVAVAGDKAFNWRKEFSPVFEKGGFDVIIGNPPYVRVQNLNYQTIDFYKNNYKVCHQRVDLYLLFFEKSYSLLKKEGLLSFINPTMFVNSDYGVGLRKFIKNTGLVEIIDFGDLSIFEDAITYTGIFTLRYSVQSSFGYIKVNNIAEVISSLQNGERQVLDIEGLSDDGWTFSSKNELQFLGKLNKGIKISDIAEINSGCFTGLDEAFFVSDEIIQKHNLENELIFPVIMGKEPKRYCLNKPIKKSIYPYKNVEGKTELIDENEFSTRFPNIYKYLLQFKPLLLQRKDSRKSFEEMGRPWYSYTRKGLIDIFEKNKILVGYIVNDNTYCLDNKKYMFSVGRVFAIVPNDQELVLGLLGILNSKISAYLMRLKCPIKQGGYFKISSKYLSELCIPNAECVKVLNEQVSSILLRSDEYQKLIETLPDLIFQKYSISITKKIEHWYSFEFSEVLQDFKKSKVQLSLSEEAEWMQYFNEQKGRVQKLKSQIEQINKEIDQMVYKLYDLTEEEIAIVEKS